MSPARGATEGSAVAMQDSHAVTASLRHIFAPRSIAVIGAGRKPGSVGRSILDNIRTGGFTGQVYAVNPRARQIGGEPCLPSVADLPEPADLAVIAVPAPALLDVAGQCGQRGIRSIAVITSGLPTEAAADLLATCRRHGMRMIGPGCFGVAVPGLGLDATFAARHPRPGRAGVAIQSGGVGVALLDHLSRLGIGVSSFASLGDKYDVSGNDLLLWWEQEEGTRLAVLYLESFGNPRTFARTARRVGKTLPVLTVPAGRSELTLFEQAGIIAARSFGELVDTAAFIASQPLPAGPRIAIVSNAGGAAAMAAEACTQAGLRVAPTSGPVRRELRGLLPAGAVPDGPVDTTAAVPSDVFGACLDRVAHDPGADALMVLVVPTAAADLGPSIQAARPDKPVAVVMLDQPEGVRMLPGTAAMPCYSSPEAAARALAHAVRHQAWRSRQGTHLPEPGGVRADDARELIRNALHRHPYGGWLGPDDVAALLACYQIPLIATAMAGSDDDAVEAAAKIGAPVALKADVPGLVHKTEAGAVRLGLHTPDEVRQAYTDFTAQFGTRLRGAAVQPMISGIEVIAGVAQDPVFGPLVVFGLGGTATKAHAGRSARLAPLTGADADELIRSVRPAPQLSGYRGSPPAGVEGLRELLLRISRLADDLPEVAELDLSPAIAGPEGVTVVGARIRLSPAISHDPLLRRLR